MHVKITKWKKRETSSPSGWKDKVQSESDTAYKGRSYTQIKTEKNKLYALFLDLTQIASF